MLFSINQKARVRKNLKDIPVKSENNLWSGQEAMEGREVLIIGAIKTNYGIKYDIEGYGRSFPEEYLEPIKEEIEYDGQIKGFARPLDNLGRVSIPIEYRRQLGLAVMEPVSMYMLNKVIRLKKGSGRNIDKLGRYTIPIEFRKTLGLKEDSLVDIYVDGSELCIKKIGLQCACCGTTEKQLFEAGGIHICTDCINDLFTEFAREE